MKNFNKNFWALYSGRTILALSSSLLGLFLPIFLFNIFDQNFLFVVIFYFFAHFIYLFTIISGAQFLNKFGYKRAMVLSSIWGVLYYISLYSMETNRDILVLLSILTILFLTLYRTFFWIPYITDFAKFSSKESRGTQTSITLVMLTIVGVIGPIVSGFLIDGYGFGIVFLIVLVLFALTSVPFLFIPKESKETFEWSHKETIKHLINKDNRRTFIALAANGAENTIGVLVWPIFIFLLLDQNYISVGTLSGVIILVTILLQILTGRYIDKKKNKTKLLRFGTFLYSIGWIIKIFVGTALQIFVVGVYHSFANIFTRTPFDTLLYDMTADRGHFMDEFTVLREISIHGGKVLVLIVIGILYLFFPLNWTFIIAAVLTLFLNYLYNDKIFREIQT